MTNTLKERFCKDMNLPIRIFDEPYFEKRLDLYNNYYNCNVDYEIFKNLVADIGGESAYFKYYNEVKDNAIMYLNESTAMKKFMNDDFSKYSIGKSNFPSSDIYHENHIGKKFLSFDMCKGNFTALKHYDASIVGNCETYYDFISMFTDKEYLKKSKYIRQVIFGNCNPKRQITYEQYLMKQVLDNILKYFDAKHIVYYSTDEIVVLVDAYDDLYVRTNAKIIVEKAISHNINIRSTIFQLNGLIEDKNNSEKIIGYVKRENDGEMDIKCVNALIMPFVIRYLYNLPADEDDKVFVYEGMLSKLMCDKSIREIGTK